MSAGGTLFFNKKVITDSKGLYALLANETEMVNKLVISPVYVYAWHPSVSFLNNLNSSGTNIPMGDRGSTFIYLP